MSRIVDDLVQFFFSHGINVIESHENLRVLVAKHLPAINGLVTNREFGWTDLVVELLSAEQLIAEQVAELQRLRKIRRVLRNACATIQNDCELTLAGNDMGGLSDSELFSAMKETVANALAQAHKEAQA